jgi:large subunit ribosomal protein L19
MIKDFTPVDAQERKKLGIRAGDTVKVWQKIQEKGKTRLQAFEGLVIAKKHGNEPGATMTVRKVSAGVGIERIFPLYSPMIEKIEIVRRSKVRRAKLYYIREKAAKEARRKMKKMKAVSEAIKDEEPKFAEEQEQIVKAEIDGEVNRGE